MLERKQRRGASKEAKSKGDVSERKQRGEQAKRPRVEETGQRKSSEGRKKQNAASTVFHTWHRFQLCRRPQPT